MEENVIVEGIPQFLDDRPEIKFLNRHVREQLCAKGPKAWKNLGTELAISIDALELWLERRTTASWRQLINALRQLQLNHLTSQIESKLIPGLEPSGVNPGQALPQPPLLTNDQLRAEFGRLIMTICRILSKSPDWQDNLESCKDLCIFLKASGNTKVPLFNQEKVMEIHNCKDFKQLFKIVNHHLSWDEHSILNEIVDECGSKEAEEEFTKYKRKMAVCKALEIISSTISSPPPGFEKFCVIIDVSYKKLTLEKYEEIKTFIFNTLDVHRYVTTGYIRVLFGSLRLEWHVTMQAVPHMITMAYEQRAVFIKSFYIFMQIGEEVIICTHTKLTSITTKPYDLFEFCFQDILDNINIKLIAPFLTTSGVILADDLAELVNLPKKSAVTFLLQKLKDHNNGIVLFKDCLAKTSESQGHQKLLSIMYSSKDSNLDSNSSSSLLHHPGPSYQSNWKQNQREKANQNPFRRTNVVDESESEWEDSDSFTYVPQQGPVFPSDPEYASEVEKIMSRSPIPVQRSHLLQDMWSRMSDATIATDKESGFFSYDSKSATPYAGSIRDPGDISSPDLRPSVSSELPEGWEVVTSEQYGIYYVNHNNHTAQYQHPVHSRAPPPYGDNRKRIPPSRSHSHRNSQVHRLRNPTSSLLRRSKSLEDTPSITVQEEDGPHQVITHDHQLSTVTYVPPSPYQIAEIPQWLREFYEFPMGSSEEEMALASWRINWNSFTLEQLKGYNTILHRLFKKDCEQVLKGLDYNKALIQKEMELRAGGLRFQHKI